MITNTQTNTTKSAPACTMTSSPILRGNINTTVERLDLALKSRKQITSFITDKQRQELKHRLLETLNKPNELVAVEHLRWIRETPYLALAGNFASFCEEFLSTSETEVNRLIDDDRQP